MKEYNVFISFNKNHKKITDLTFKQGDSGEKLILILEDKIDFNNYIASIIFNRPDGSVIEGTVTHKGNNRFEYTIKGNELKVPGKVVADVKFRYEQNRVSTASFTFTVEKDTISDMNYDYAVHETDILEQALNQIMTIKNYLFLGEYDRNTTYEIGNTVQYEGSYYRCIKKCIGIEPLEEEETVYWALIVKRGNPGEMGRGFSYSRIEDTYENIEVSNLKEGEFVFCRDTTNTYEVINGNLEYVSCIKEIIEKLLPDNSYARLNEDGKVQESQLPIQEIKKYSLAARDGCQTLYATSRVVQQGNIIMLHVDATFAKNVKSGTYITLAEISKIKPGSNFSLNTITNKGKNCYLTVTADGLINITAIDELVVGDGIRIETMYFMAH